MKKIRFAHWKLDYTFKHLNLLNYCPQWFATLNNDLKIWYSKYIKWYLICPYVQTSGKNK